MDTFYATIVKFPMPHWLIHGIWNPQDVGYKYYVSKMWEDYLWNLTSNRRTMMNPYSWNNSFMGTGSLDRFFDRIERLMSNADIKVEKRRTVSFTVTEGDNEAIDRAIEILESLRACR